MSHDQLPPGAPDPRSLPPGLGQWGPPEEPGQAGWHPGPPAAPAGGQPGAGDHPPGGQPWGHPPQPPSPPPAGYPSGPGTWYPPGGHAAPPGYVVGYHRPPRRLSPFLLAGGGVLLLLLVGVGSAFALQLGPFAPAASARPSAAAVAPSAAPAGVAASGDLSASAPASAAPARNPDEERLLATIPQELRSGCTAEAPTSGDVLARYSCRAGDTTASYWLHDSQGAMQEQYERGLRLAPLPDPRGTDCQTGPSEHGYTIQGEQVGRVFCFADAGLIVFNWSDPRLHVIAAAAGCPRDGCEGSAEEFGALYSFWVTAGPNPADGGAPPPEPTLGEPGEPEVTEEPPSEEPLPPPTDVGVDAALPFPLIQYDCYTYSGVTNRLRVEWFTLHPGGRYTADRLGGEGTYSYDPSTRELRLDGPLADAWVGVYVPKGTRSERSAYIALKAPDDPSDPATDRGAYALCTIP